MKAIMNIRTCRNSKESIASLVRMIVSVFCVVSFAFSQNYQMGSTAIMEWGTSGTVSGGHNAIYSRMSLTMDEVAAGISVSSNYSTTVGLWGFYHREPFAPQFSASDGAQPGCVRLNWKQDVLDPPCTINFSIYKDGSLKFQPMYLDTTRDDSTALPGEFYLYSIQAQNSFGLGDPAEDTGFENPNGGITGRVTTPHNNPVNDVEVSIDPTNGTALQFDGTDDYVKVPHDSSLAGMRALTLSVWVKPSDTTRTYQNIIVKGMNDYLLRIDEDGNLVGAVNDFPLTATGVIRQDIWQHVALTWNGEDTSTANARLYHNGNLVATRHLPTSQVVVSDAPVFIGALNESYEYFQGYIDEVRIWKVARDSAGINQQMHRVMNTSVPGLVSAWLFDENIGYVAFDVTDNNNDGTINGPQWSTDRPDDLHIGAFTGEDGYYNISSILYDYNQGTNFTVSPSKPGHNEWNPDSRVVSLDKTDSHANQIDFTDDSMIPVKGYVKYANTECYVEGVEIKEITADGDTVSMTPAIFTADDGSFTVDFEPGSSHRLYFDYKDHTFDPTFYDVIDIIEPITIGFIDDTRLRTLEIKVVGGSCEYPIGVADINIRTPDGCYVTTGSTNHNGRLQITNLPASNFQVIVDKLNGNAPPDDISAGLNVSLVDGNNSIMFIHNEPVQAELQWPAVSRKGAPVDRTSTSCTEQVKVIEQYDTLDVIIAAFRQYVDPQNNTTLRCYLDTGSVIITDYISDNSGTRTLSISCPDTVEPSLETMPVYTFIPGVPNILGGGEHPYQKNMTITAKDTAGQESDAITDWVYVTGHKPRAQTFTSSMPEMPYHIIHDPPGDGSYVQLDEETRTTTSWSFNAGVSFSDNIWNKVKVGTDFIEGLGMETETKAVATGTESFTIGFGFNNSEQWSTTVMTSDVFQTSTSDAVVGEAGDIYVGGALNVIYGITDVLDWDDNQCAPVKDTTLAIVPGGFETFFIYTESHIKNNIIPQLRDVLNDTVSANLWQSFVDMNEANKRNAKYKRNISFSADAEYSHTESTTKDTVIRFDFNMYIVQEVAMELDLEEAGAGDDFGWDIKLKGTAGGSYTHESANTTVTKYVLQDDDYGDYFSVDIKEDRVYGTPVFDVRAGASSCPWEEGTQKRQQVQLVMDSYEATNVPQDGEANFTLNAGNISESEEDNQYAIRQIQESNPHGAVLRIDGTALGSGVIPVTIPPGESRDLTLTVGIGPSTTRYDDLQVMLYAPCEYTHWQDAGITIPEGLADTVTFSVHFEELCESDIAISYPSDNWLITQEDNDILHFTVDGYDRNDPNFVGVYFEYAYDEGSFYGNQWIIADTISIDTILSASTNYIQWVWDVTNVIDGPYWIRVKSLCSDGMYTYSDALHGYIDRQYPTVLGTQPADGVLGPNDEITITFTQPIDCYQLWPDYVELFNVTRNKPVPIQDPIGCEYKTITIVPDVQNYFIENDVLRAIIHNVKTTQNTELQQPYSWEFVVDRNPVHWNEPVLKTADTMGVDQVLITTLRNTGTALVEFSFSSDPWWTQIPHGPTPLPWWIDLSPADGSIAPGGEVEITLTLSGMLNFGEHSATIYAHTSEGDEPLTIQVRTLCKPPVWELDEQAYQYNMAVNAQISVRDTISEDPYDYIAAFVDREGRGVAPLEHVVITEWKDTLITEFGHTYYHQYLDTLYDNYIAFLTVHSNLQSGETVAFRLWDAGDCEEYWEIDKHVEFESNSVVGSPTNPTVLNATGAVAQFVDLDKGWTWFSIHLSHTDENLNINSVLPQELGFKNGDRIIHQNEFESYSEATGRWAPGTMVLDPSTMYKAHLDTLNQAIFVGFEINPDSLTINLFPSWNWLGYPLRYIHTVNGALQNLTPENGSKIKDELNFAEYVESLNQWIGSLEWMVPGHGYLFQSTATDTLTFTYSGLGVGQDQRGLPRLTASGSEEGFSSPWSFDYRYFMYNMPVIATIDDKELDLATVVVGAMVDGEVRGIARAKFVPALDKYQIYLMVHSNRKKGEKVDFKLYDPKTKTIHNSDQSLTFNSEKVAGRVEAPLLLTKKIIPDQYILSQNYPNPFNPNTMIKFGLPEAADVSIKAFDILGREVTTIISGHLSAGYHEVVWNGKNRYGNNLSSGVYFIVMKSGPFMKIRKVVLLK